MSFATFPFYLRDEFTEGVNENSSELYFKSPDALLAMVVLNALREAFDKNPPPLPVKFILSIHDPMGFGHLSI